MSFNKFIFVYFVCGFLAVNGGAVFAQSSTISGYVKDAETGEVLIGSRVYSDSLKIGCNANQFGFYSLTLPNGTHTLVYSFVGKEPERRSIELKESIELDIRLKSRENLETIEVSGEKKRQESTEIGTIDLSMSKVEALPVLFGERDILKVAQLLPGIQSGSEGSNGIYVRGGGPDQNLILLDGVPIYNVNHLFGFFSVFNEDAVSKVKVVKGGFPAEYGGRISSVVDINMIDGDMKKLHGEGSIGLISSKLMLNGPIIKDKTSFMISGRRTYWDLISRPIINQMNKGSNFKTKGGYFFHDVNAKINHIINSKNRIYLSTYLGDDRFFLDEQSGLSNDISRNGGGLNWGNKIVALRWNHKFGPKLFLNTTVTHSRYDFETGFFSQQGNLDNPSSKYSFDYSSRVLDWGGNMNFYYYPNPNHQIQFGVGETYHTFSPGASRFQFIEDYNLDIDLVYGALKTYTHEFFAYIQDDFKINRRLSANLGVHLSNFYVQEKLYNILQPRAAFNFSINEKSSFKASYSRMAQFLHLLTNTSFGLPTDLWVPVTSSIPPQIGDQVSLGYVHELSKGFNLNIEGYYKTMQNMIVYKDGASILDFGKNWENLIEIGNGNSYGAEILFEKKRGKTTGWVGYTLSWTNRQFENVNFGEKFPARYDRRHDISFVMTHKFNDRLDIGIVWVYGTGNAITLPLQQYETLGDDNFPSETVPHVVRNNYRVPAYHRLDLGINLHKEKKWGEVVWSFGVYNAYNRQNPYYLTLEDEDFDIEDLLEGESFSFGKKTLKQVSLFPVIPSISYSFKF